MFKRIVACAPVVLLSLVSLQAPVLAQSGPYPNRPIRLIVPYPPAGAIDPIARVIAKQVSEAWGVPIIIENKPGAGTVIGTQLVAQAAPDGYTLLVASSNHVINPVMMSKLPYDSVKGFEPISLISIIPFMLTVNPEVPAKSVAELISYAKAQPGKINFSSTGDGGTTHLAGEYFKSMAGVELVHVPYKGSNPSMMGVVSGEVQMTLDSVFMQKPQVDAGKLRALAVTAPRRMPIVPELPTISESGLTGYEAYSWAGLLAPAGTSPEIIQKWQKEIERIMKSPEIRDAQLNQGLDPVGSSSEYFAKFIGVEMAKWGKVIKEAKIPVQ